MFFATAKVLFGTKTNYSWSRSCVTGSRTKLNERFRFFSLSCCLCLWILVETSCHWLKHTEMSCTEHKEDTNERMQRWQAWQGNEGLGWAAWRQGRGAISDTLGHMRDPGRRGGHSSFCSGSWARADGRAAFARAMRMSFSVFCAAIVIEVAAFLSLESGLSSVCFQGLPENFGKEMVRNDGGRRTLSCDEESRVPQWKQNIHIFLSILVSSLLIRLNKQSCKKKNLTLKKLV